MRVGIASIQGQHTGPPYRASIQGHLWRPRGCTWTAHLLASLDRCNVDAIEATQASGLERLADRRGLRRHRHANYERVILSIPWPAPSHERSPRAPSLAVCCTVPQCGQQRATCALRPEGLLSDRPAPACRPVRLGAFQCTPPVSVTLWGPLVWL